MDNNNSGLLAIIAVVGLLFFMGPCKQNPPTPQQGPKTILLWYEATTAPPTFHNLTLTDLRAGTQAKYLDDQKHLFLWLDPQNPGTTTRKDVATAIEAARKQGDPAIVIVDPSSGSLIGSAKLDFTWTADQVIELIKKNGG